MRPFSLLLHQRNGHLHICKYHIYREPLRIPVHLIVLTHHWQIFTSKPPFPAHPYGRGVMKIIDRAYVLEQPAEISNPMWDILERCWSYNPGDRPTMDAFGSMLAEM